MSRNAEHVITESLNDVKNEEREIEKDRLQTVSG